VNRISDN